MELNSEQIVKLIEQVSGIPELLKKEGELAEILEKFKKVEGYLSRFKNLEELTSHLMEIEDKIYLCKTYLTTNEAAAYVSMSKFTLLEAAKRGDITFFTPPSKFYYFTKEDLDNWLSGFRIPCNKELKEQIEKEEQEKNSNGR